MFPTIVGVAGDFEAAVRSQLDKSDIMEMRELLARFTTDVIGTCAFGIQCNSFKHPDTEFLRYGRIIMEIPQKPMLLRHFIETFNELAIKMRIRILQPSVSNFFIRVVKDTIALREVNHIQRNDFMNLLIEQKKPEEFRRWLGNGRNRRTGICILPCRIQDVS